MFHSKDAGLPLRWDVKKQTQNKLRSVQGTSPRYFLAKFLQRLSLRPPETQA
jgi:hypothetical protein